MRSSYAFIAIGVLASCCCCGPRQGDAKHRTAAWCVFDLDLAAVRLDGPLGDRQTKTGSTALPRTRLIDAEETVENPLAVFGGNARPLVDDFDEGVAVS